MSRQPKWKVRAIAIEFSIAAIVVGGSFVVGFLSAVRYFFGD